MMSATPVLRPRAVILIGAVLFVDNVVCLFEMACVTDNTRGRCDQRR